VTPEHRQRIEQLVRPLYAGLDGVQTFARVERLRARAEEIRGGEAVDADLLELLLLLHGAVDRLGSLAAGGRLDLFLRGLGLPEERVRLARAGLGRFREDPRRPEEKLLHDALLVESAGVPATAERLMAAGRKRLPLDRALAQLDPGPAAERYATPRGALLGTTRRRAAEAWIEDLRRAVATGTTSNAPGGGRNPAE
jgi:hypothetical protein